MKIDHQMLLGLAGQRSYERGLAYFGQGRVRLARIGPDHASADVSGNEDYRVELELPAGAVLKGRCDCPVGQQGAFCKHQVAVALAWVNGTSVSAPLPARRQNGSGAGDTLQLRNWLAAQPPQALQALVLELAGADPGLRQRLLSQACLTSAPSQQWRKAVSALIGRRRFMDYHASIAYARQLAPLPQLLEQALQRDAAAALDLHEYAFKRLQSIYQNCDDSAGHVGEQLDVLADMHPQFVMAAPPKNLPARLFDLYTGDAWNLMPPVQEYVEALGEAGVGTLEQLAYRALLEHGDQKPSESYRLAFEQLLEQTAACGGDVETMLRYFARRCQSGGEHLAMARRCREHGRQRQEIEWLERGAKAHPQDSRVLAALAKAYAREGFIEDALALRWQAYLLIPGEEAYLALRETALIAGQWETWRVRALQTLDGVRMYGTSAMDLRIRLLLAEGENRQALALAQESANVSVSTWEWLLPTAIAHDVPSALRIHHALIQDNIERTHRQAYLVAIKWLRSLQKLHGEHGSPIDFDNHRDQLRQRYRSKRSFIELLDASFPDASR